MKEVKIGKCPFCGCEETIETRLVSYGGVSVVPAHRGGLRSSTLYATVCRDCGSVIRAYCNDPEKLLPRKERKL